VTNILKRDEIPAELLEAISSLLAFYQSLKEEGKLKEPGE
jgi:type III secretion system FlhB-like substrate exporter